MDKKKYQIEWNRKNKDKQKAKLERLKRTIKYIENEEGKLIPASYDDYIKIEKAKKLSTFPLNK